jgi:cytochrome P450
VPTPGNVVRWQRERMLDREVFAILDAEAEPGSLLADLKAATDESGGMSREQLRDEVVTLFLAGHETTALLLTWALVLLAQHPNAERAVEEEARTVAGSASIAFEHRDKLAFTERVLKETLRLYPPVYVIPRVVGEPLTLAGYPLEPGAEVWLWPYFTHRDARFFARPERFEPNRFLPGGEAERSPRAYLPFGAGSRACVGRHFALLEAVLALASITRRFRVKLRDGRPVFPHPRITLAPARAVRARVEER